MRQPYNAPPASIVAGETAGPLAGEAGTRPSWAGGPATEANRSRIAVASLKQGRAAFNAGFISAADRRNHAHTVKVGVVLTVTSVKFRRDGNLPEGRSGSRHAVRAWAC